MVECSPATTVNEQSSDKWKSKATKLASAGFAITALAFVLFIAINGSPGIPTEVPEITLLLVGLGFFSSAGGCFLLTARTTGKIRKGLTLEGIGIVVLFIGIVLAEATSSLNGFLASALVLSFSASFTLLGAHFLLVGGREASPRAVGIWVHAVGMVLLFSGAAVIVAFNILVLTYSISNVGGMVYEDIGATISAYGCVLGSYAFKRLFF